MVCVTVYHKNISSDAISYKTRHSIRLQRIWAWFPAEIKLRDNENIFFNAPQQSVGLSLLLFFHSHSKRVLMFKRKGCGINFYHGKNIFSLSYRPIYDYLLLLITRWFTLFVIKKIQLKKYSPKPAELIVVHPAVGWRFLWKFIAIRAQNFWRIFFISNVV